MRKNSLEKDFDLLIQQAQAVRDKHSLTVDESEDFEHLFMVLREMRINIAIEEGMR